MKIAFIGDIALTGILVNQPELNDIRFEQISNELANLDYIFANLEVPAKVSDEQNEFKDFIHYSDYFTTKTLLPKFNVSCVSLANNHVYDCKMSGLKATVSVLDELNIKHTGAGWKKEHIEPVMIRLNEIKLGFIAYVDVKTNPKTENFPELFINYFELENVKKDIQKLKKKADKIIISIHWGSDYSHYPTPVQILQAHELVEAGADIIMGHHPHTFQPYEAYKHGLILYSLGGLTFGDYLKNGEMRALYRKTKMSAIVSCDLSDMSFNFLPTKELKGNFIKIGNRDYNKWSKIMWMLHKLKNSHTSMEWMFDFNEKIIYRVYEYFFGYYQNPLKRMFQLSNIKKFLRLCSNLTENRR